MKINSILMIGNYLQSPKHNRNIWHALSERLSDMGWCVITTSSKEAQLLRLLDMLYTIFKHRNHYACAQIDVFSGKAFLFAELCSFLLHALHKPIVLTLHGGGLPKFSKKYPGRVQRLLDRADFVITPSPYLQKQLAHFNQDIRVIPNPINLSAAIFKVRKDPEPHLIWVRAFHEIYNPSLAPAVVKLLLPNFPNIHLYMVGPDKGDGSLEQMMGLMKRLGVEQNIDIIGGVQHKEIPIWLDKADIFINTSKYDTAPRSLLEAMANGLCIVSTNVGGIPYLIEDKKAGLLVPPNDSKAMADAIQSILIHSELAEYLSVNAHEVSKRNKWSTVVNMWNTLFLKVLDRSNE